MCWAWPKSFTALVPGARRSHPQVLDGREGGDAEADAGTKTSFKRRTFHFSNRLPV